MDKKKTHSVESQLNIPAVSMSYAALLAEMMTAEGVDRHSLLKGTALTEEALAKQDSFATLSQFKALVNRAFMLSHNDALGLYFGQQLNIASHGFLGYAIMSSHNTVDAFSMAMKYIKIRNRLTGLNVSLQENSAILELESFLPEGRFNRFMVEHAFSSLHHILQFLSGMDVAIEKFCFRYERPDYADQYDALFKTQVLFGQSKNQVVLTGENFNQASKLADPLLAELAQKQCEILLASIDNDRSLTERIKQIVNETSGQFPSSDFMAKQLGLSPRTFSRQLQAVDTTYKAIIDDIKLNRAIEYLSMTTWSIDEISELLDYSDSSNFRRAFKKWMGQTPNDYRVSLRE